MLSKPIIIASLLILLATMSPKLLAHKLASSDFATAEERINHAITERRTVLDFSDLPYLRSIPETIHKVEDLWHLNASSSKRLEDIQSLANLPDLKHVQLAETRVSDLSALSTLSSLEVLDIRDTWVADLTPLTQATNLNWLQMNNLAVNSLCPLNDVRSLNRLNVHKSYASDGSKDCFEDLANGISDLAGGSAFRQNYIPGFLYKLKISSERFFQYMEWR